MLSTETIQIYTQRKYLLPQNEHNHTDMRGHEALLQMRRFWIISTMQTADSICRYKHLSQNIHEKKKSCGIIMT